MVIFVLSPRSPIDFHASGRRAQRSLGEDERDAVSVPATRTLSRIHLFAAPPFEKSVKRESHFSQFRCRLSVGKGRLHALPRLRWHGRRNRFRVRNARRRGATAALAR
jgi:hypothetical protein